MLMIYPSIDDLLKKVDSRYSLVIMSAKRARQLLENESLRDDVESLKEVSSALRDVHEGKISYERTKDGIK